MKGKLITLLRQQMANLLRKIEEDNLDEEEEEEEELPILTEGGNLHLLLQSAVLERNTEAFGKMDPYCKIKYLGQEYKSKVHNDGGKTPVWDEIIELEVGPHNGRMHVGIWDDDIGTDDLIGELLLEISELMNLGSH